VESSVSSLISFCCAVFLSKWHNRPQAATPYNFPCTDNPPKWWALQGSSLRRPACKAAHRRMHWNAGNAEAHMNTGAERGHAVPAYWCTSLPRIKMTLLCGCFCGRFRRRFIPCDISEKLKRRQTSFVRSQNASCSLSASLIMHPLGLVQSQRQCWLWYCLPIAFRSACALVGTANLSSVS
jgi:hypothetical protein